MASPTVAVVPEPPPTSRMLRDAAPLLLAVGLLMAGNGLTSTLLGVRSQLEGFPATVTGIVLAGYYLGFIAGSVSTPKMIRRVGHIRVFAGLASLASAAVLLHVVRPDAFTWFTLRAVSGLCISGLYVVTETWLNGAATNTARGSLLAAYMVVVTGGLGAGQVLFSIADPGGFAAFVLASVLVSLAVVPVSLATVRAPEVLDPQRMSIRGLVEAAPLAPVGAALSGFTGAAMVGAGAVYAVETGLGQNGTAALIAAALVGGLVLQAPLGRWSDRTDRRVVIVAAGLLGAAASVAAAAVGPDPRLALIALTFVAGGVSFPLYSLSNAHLNDYLESGRIVAAGARMVLVNGAGAVGGPIVGAAALHAFGPGALFVVIAIGYAVVAAFAGWRITRRAPVPEAERAHYVPLPSGATPVVATLQEGVGEELFPLSERFVDIDGYALPYRQRGTGEAVVLLHETGAGSAVWDEALPALAAVGIHAIAPHLRGTPATTVAEYVDDVLGLLRGLELPAASFVGCGDAVDVVRHLATEHPDRVTSVVVIGEGRPDDSPLGRPELRIGVDGLHVDDPALFADHVVDFLRHQGARAE